MILGNAMPLAVPQIIVLPLNVLEYVGPHHAVGWGECEEEERKEGRDTRIDESRAATRANTTNGNRLLFAAKH